MKLLVLVASIRQGRIGGAIGDWVSQAARGHNDLAFEVVDLQKLQLPLHDEPNHPRLGDYVGEPAKKWSATVSGADAFIFVMPEYNHSFSAPLKNAIDYLHTEWVGKPVGLVSYGGLSGGTRAVTALQPVLVNLGMICLRGNVELAWAGEQVTEGRFGATERQQRALDALLGELLSHSGGHGL